MKKILILIGKPGVSHHVMDFIADCAKQEQIKVSGLFMTSLTKADEDNYPFPSDINLAESDHSKQTDAEEAKFKEETNMNVFESACKAAGLNCDIKKIHEDYLDNIVDETAFADLIVCDDDMKTVHFWMNSFVSSAHCPVLLVPEGYSAVKETVFAFDGSPSSIHAMKQFTYLFPWFQKEKASLVSVLPSNVTEIDYRSQVEEWLFLHYPKAEIIIFKGSVKSQLPDLVNKRKNSLLVMGAFGRNALSRLFKESFAFTVLEKTMAPVFIAHL
jgi:hypothetical protein